MIVKANKIGIEIKSKECGPDPWN